jgi:predicted small secreted protein
MRSLSWLMALSIAFALSACNTVKGVGQDIQKAGEKIEDAAKKK